MELNGYQPSLNEQLCAKALIELLKGREKQLALDDAVVHHNFPLYLDSDGSVKNTDLMIISKKYGVLIFKCLDGSKRLPDHIDKLILDFEQVYYIILSKLIKSKNVRKSAIPLKSIVYCSGVCDSKRIKNVWDDLEVIRQDGEINTIFKNIRLETELNETLFNEILSILEGSQSLIKKSERPIDDFRKKTKGYILSEIEDQIAIFDAEQKSAALKIIDGPQRIRGLAGSGKTIVLAMKAAMIHLHEPDSHILYTYWTKQLHDYIKRLITRFYRQYSENDPNWDKIDIIHAWGGRNVRGVYYNTCINNGIRPQSLEDTKQYGKEAFNKACELVVKSEKLRESYDYSILDEAQDFPVNFYRICRMITKRDRVIWGYDECQNILNIEIQDTIKTFGKNSSGEPYIDFTKTTILYQDLVLHKCYRNPRTILVAAIALGFGIYSDKIIQLPENLEHWIDLGFEISKGQYKKGEQMIITRPEKNSPLIKNRLLDKKNNAIKWKVFETFDEECQFVTESIIKDLKEELIPEDIIVISLDDRNAKNYFDNISLRLNNNVKTFNLLNQPFVNIKFMIENHITLTTVYRAKGNEAGCVYIVGIDSIFSNKNSIVERNKLFTSMTRAKAWVTITGVGNFASEFEKEIKAIVNNNYELIFTMPDLNTLRRIQRDLANKQAELNRIREYIVQKAVELGIDPDELLKNIEKKVPE
ncbi:Uncharacterised protein [uncultured archaeon]|nr:Uncharacterised protein [uncultured archaeon]